jgi:hypothetical protein
MNTQAPTPPDAAAAPTDTQATAPNSLEAANDKIRRLIDMYAPTHLGREGALTALHAGLAEFEAAVREDEKAKIEAAAGVGAPAIGGTSTPPDDAGDPSTGSRRTTRKP